MSQPIRHWERIGEFEFAAPYFIERSRSWVALYRFAGGVFELREEAADPCDAFRKALDAAMALRIQASPSREPSKQSPKQKCARPCADLPLFETRL